MTYRRTNFGTAENEQLIQSVSAQLYAIQAGFVKTKGLLDAGHLEAGHREAGQTQDRIDVAERLISSSRELAQFLPALNVAKANMTRTWSRFQATAEGRANFNGIGDYLDNVGEGIKQDTADAMNLAEKGQGVVQKGKEAWDFLKSSGEAIAGAISGSSDGPPDGTVLYLPSCMPNVGATPQMLVVAATFGIPFCSGPNQPIGVKYVVGEPRSATVARIAAVNAGLGNTSLVDAVAAANAKATVAQQTSVANRATSATRQSVSGTVGRGLTMSDQGQPQQESSGGGIGFGLGLAIAGGLLKLFVMK